MIIFGNDFSLKWAVLIDIQRKNIRSIHVHFNWGLVDMKGETERKKKLIEIILSIYCDKYSLRHTHWHISKAISKIQNMMFSTDDMNQ